MKAVGCLVRSLNDKLIYLTASICKLLILPEFYLFCRHRELKEIEFYSSWEDVFHCILTSFLLWRRSVVLGAFIDARLLALKRTQQSFPADIFCVKKIFLCF